MYRKDVDNIAKQLLAEQGGELSRKEITRRFEREYSRDQRDRIYYRYRYLLQFWGNTSLLAVGLLTAILG